MSNVTSSQKGKKVQEEELAFIALGSNLGKREQFLAFALQRLSTLPLSKISLISPCYETKPVGVEENSQGFYLNAVIGLRTNLEPLELLKKLLHIEREAGRTREKRWGPRTLDLDLLFVGTRQLDEIGPPRLHLPHPRLHLRRFVLQPLADIAPNFVHPVFRRTIHELFRACSDTSPVLSYEPRTIVWHPRYS